MQPCLQEAKSWRGEASWHLLKEFGLREVVIKISNTKKVGLGGGGKAHGGSDGSGMGWHRELG